jgi:glycolate oxidase
MTTAPSAAGPGLGSPGTSRATAITAARRDLEEALGREAVLSDPLALRLYARDASMLEGSCALVVLPSTREEVVACVRIARRHGLDVVPRGAGTGLAGGSTPLLDSVVIVTTRLDRIIEIRPADRLAWVEPGVLNLDLKRRLAPLGLTFAPDPASEASSTVGGNVATNAGGPHCLAYGVTANHVFAVELVLADGAVERFGAETPESGGYDLRGVIIGSEGTVGIITAACVRLSPLPASVQVVLLGFATVDAAAAVVSEIIAEGLTPAAIELMDRAIVRVVEDFAHAGYPVEAEAVVLVELDGLPGGVERQRLAVERIARHHGATDIQAASDPAHRARLWKGRKSAHGAITRIAPDFLQYDVVVPRTRLVDALAAVREVARDEGLIIAHIVHAGDGNLHPLIMYDRHAPGALDRVLAAGERIVRACLEMGGSISGEHGIGLEKRDFMPLMYSAADLDLNDDVRAAFDPMRTMNPGKIISDVGRPHGTPAGGTPSSPGVGGEPWTR